VRDSGKFQRRRGDEGVTGVHSAGHLARGVSSLLDADVSSYRRRSGQEARR
jgi:hypothetical protein